MILLNDIDGVERGHDTTSVSLSQLLLREEAGRPNPTGLLLTIFQ